MLSLHSSLRFYVPTVTVVRLKRILLLLPVDMRTYYQASIVSTNAQASAFPMSSSQIASIKAQSHFAFCVVNDACRFANYVIDSPEKGLITFPLLLLPSTFSWPDHYCWITHPI
ncbi:hypothetical protein K439DRAFT_1633329 [Ramaria rubella]|nr:hypothetical protein K439DRAFT_1633329 [Ramaria rubella]